MACKVLQINTNHAREAHGMMLHSLAELDCGLGIISEPYIHKYSKEGPNWVVSSDNMAAVEERKTLHP